MSLEGRKKLSEARKGIIPWNKGLTKEDPRVLRNVSGGCKKTQFKPGPRPHTIGEKNNNWKGGKIKKKASNGQNYMMLRLPEHPMASNNYVFEHRVIMEKILGRTLKEDEVVHHINDNPLDNRPENLQVTTQSEHIKLHMVEKNGRLLLSRANRVTVSCTATPEPGKREA